MLALDRYLAPLSQRMRDHRAANEAQAQQGLARELRYWTDQASQAVPNSDYWHECMDELDKVKTLMRAT